MPSALHHMVCAQDIGMVVANVYGRAQTAMTLRAALAAIGSMRCVLLLMPCYSHFPDMLPGDHIWIIDEDITFPSHITLYIAPRVFCEGSGDLILFSPFIAFEDPWYRGSGTVHILSN